MTDATTNLNVEEDLSLKDNALLFEMDARTNLIVAEDLSRLIWFVEVTGSHTNNAKVLHETVANCIGNCWSQQLAALLKVLGLGKYQLAVASPLCRSMLCLAS